MNQGGLYAQLIGNPVIYWQGQALPDSQPKLTAIIAFLSHEQEVSRQVLAEQFWNEPKSGSVRTALHRLKAFPGAAEWLNVSKTHVTVNATTDLQAIGAAVKEQTYDELLAPLKEGPLKLLEGLEVKDADGFKTWQQQTLQNTMQQISQSIQKQIDKLEQETDFATAIGYAQILLGCDQLDESLHRMIMRLEHKRGNREAALAQYEQCRRILQKELGIDPIDETKALLKDIERSGTAGSQRALILKDPKDVPSQAETLVGRAQLLEDLHTKLKNSDRILLHGFGGTGKTSVAAAAATHWLETHSSIIWLQAGHSNADALFDAIARALESQQELAQSSNKSEFLRKQLIESNITLIVLDDLWNSYALEHFTKALPHHLALLVTARERHPKLKRIDVNKLKRPDALKLISYHAKLELSKKQSKELKNLCALLDDHPFTLRIAGVTLATQDISPKELYKQIKDNPHDLKIPTDYAKEGRESVTSLLSVTLNAMSDAAHEALLAMGTLPTSSCTASLLSHALRRDENDLEDALIELQRRGSAERVTEPGSDTISYRLHDLIYSFARANKYLRDQTIVRASITLLNEHKTSYDLLDAELNNLLSAAEIAKHNNPYQFIEIMKGLVVGEAYFVARGHTQQSIQLLEDAVNVAEGLELIEDAHYLTSRLGDGHRETFGNISQALKHYQTALKFAKQQQNRHRECIILSLVGLMKFLISPKSDFKTDLDSAYKLSKSQKDDLALSHVLQNLSYVAGTQDDLTSAKEACLESVGVAKRLLNPKKNPNQQNTRFAEERLFFSLINLAEAERELLNYSEAQRAIDEAMSLSLEKENKFWKAYVYESLAECLHAQKKREEAQINFTIALKFYEDLGAITDHKILYDFLTQNGYTITTS